jgi:hypothetical protein
VQVTGVPVQVPFWHVSLVVHVFPSLQPVPLGAGGFEQVPFVHVPATWQASRAVQVTGVPVQVPFWHVSFIVHALPSLHEAPFGFAGFEQVPRAESQEPAT